MKEEPLVSVIIPTYKRPGMLGRAIDSVLNQTYDNIEIIVVDDNDENSEYRKETEEFMENYSDVDNLVYLKHKFNKGGGPARNTGIENSTGKYIAFLDDDDEYLPEMIFKSVKKIESSKLKNLALVYCQSDFYDSGNKLIGKTKNYYKGNKIPFEKNLINTLTGTPTILAKKEALVNINGFKDLASGQDWYLILKILDYGYNVDFLRESLVNVYIHENERISNGHSKIQSLDEILEIKRQYFKKIDKTLIKSILYEHYMQKANHIKKFNKLKSFIYFTNAIKYRIKFMRDLKYLFSLILNKKQRNYLKNFYLKLKENI